MVKNITKPFFEINDYPQVFSPMNDVKQTTWIEGCFKYFSFKGKIRNRGKKIRPSSIRLPFFYLCVTSGPPDQFDRLLFHVKSSEFRLMNRPLWFEIFHLAKTQQNGWNLPEFQLLQYEVDWLCHCWKIRLNSFINFKSVITLKLMMHTGSSPCLLKDIFEREQWLRVKALSEKVVDLNK